ncbi:MAG: stage II sporulation protein D [Clostridia bacterium]|nr:stage II sporulation protein D [Clostridia bacterium]
MRRFVLGIIILVFIMMVLIPALVVSFFRTKEPGKKAEITPAGIQLRVLMVDTGQVETMPLEDYLVGVVAGEMPALFEKEALKAQAVAARTYALKRRELSQGQGNGPHPQADICTDPSHCQAWLSAKEMKERWGFLRYLTYHRKIKEAVGETEGVVITYQGKLIDPVYHSTSNGKTENSGEIWKFDIPYLKSVESIWDLESPKYEASVSYPLKEVEQRLGVNLQMKNSGTALPLQILEKTTGGRIRRIKAGEKEFTGEEFRRLLGLPSADCSWRLEGDLVVFSTKGYGHGVGLSQYGANGMAKEGKNFQEILTYYYTGVQLYRVAK